MNEVNLLIGGNMGDRIKYLADARSAIEAECGKIIHASNIYETEAWGITDQEKFLNQALTLHTTLPPLEVLDAILQIEEQLGRKRAQKYGPRLIDIDILLYDDAVIDSGHLKVPHPEMQNRRFALQCLADIAPDKLHPLFHKTIRQLLAECTDPLRVQKIN